MKLLTPPKALQLKNKTKTYVLLVIVFGIWGIIGYRIWSGFNTEVPVAKQHNFAVSFNPDTNTVIDTFSVQLASRDPFLGTLNVLKTKKANTTISRKQNNFVWLPISYLGLITKQGATQKIFVLTINGKQHLLKKGQTMDSVTLIRGNTKAIVLRYKNQQKKFNKSK